MGMGFFRQGSHHLNSIFELQWGIVGEITVPNPGHV